MQVWDIIELGMPFTDPAADGPVIELAGLRSLKAGTNVGTILDMATEFRKTNDATPIILMGYANPVHHMGYEKFAKAAYTAGIDGAIIVDLPPEEGRGITGRVRNTQSRPHPPCHPNYRRCKAPHRFAPTPKASSIMYRLQA